MPVEWATLPTKKIICEACRKAKRRCSGSVPCERCIRNKIECNRVQHLNPEDLEYIQLFEEQRLTAEVQNLTEQLDNIQAVMQSVHDQQAADSADSTPIVSSDGQDESMSLFSGVEGSSLVSQSSISSTQPMDNFASLIKFANQTLQERSNQNELEDEKAKLELLKQSSADRATEWTLTMSKSGLTINTSIQTFADLIFHIPQLASIAISGVQFPMTEHVRQNPASLIVKRVPNPSFALRRSLLLAALKSIEAVRHRRMLNDNQYWISEERANELANKLVRTYFECLHYKRIVIHRKAFLDMFIKGKQNILSGGVCAFSAAIITMRCRHLLGIVSLADQEAVGEFFFNRAREAISETFDEVSLENYFTLLWMARYKVSMLEPEDAKKYIEMAERQSELLAPTYSLALDANHKQSPRDMGRTEMYRRLFLARREVNSAVSFLENKRGVPLTKSEHRVPHSSFDEKEREQRYSAPAKITPDDSILEKRGILRDRFMRMLEKGRQLGMKLRWAEIDQVSLKLIAEYEQRLKEWMTTDLAMSFYSAFLSLHEMLLPKLTDYARRSNNLFQHSEATEQDGDNESNMPPLNTPPNEHALRSQHVCSQAANLIVDLAKYQLEELGICNIEMAIFGIVWDVQLRNARLGQSIKDSNLSPMEKSMTITARQKLMSCVELVQQGYQLNSVEVDLRRFVAETADRIHIALAEEEL
ncbi:hypothetical protein INT43_008529 [Umbelopsis isabellina]|uniref:Zn(2)-C6 fungal-type domain-containing protein n=1 Tax=Mortierella isabellina TaxID=91625 RepID=A0A8H7PWV8_MORIS|nr:hypothetical protein INT43_008529 [Umbelopsis isabellina]